MKSDRSWMPDETDLDWIEATAPEPHAVLVAIEAAAEPERIPILDRASGRVLATLAATRSRIVEVGTAIGYSTLWMGLAQPAGGRIVLAGSGARPVSTTTGSRSSTRLPSMPSRRASRSWPARSTSPSSTP